MFWKTYVQLEHLKPVAETETHKKCFVMGLILNEKRSRRSGDKANAISFIRDNFAFLDMV